jgi:ribosomal protein L44E
MSDGLHFIISDCVARARSLSELPACAPTLREVTCQECLRFIDETFKTWTERYESELDVQQRRIRRNAQILERQRKLIAEGDKVIAARGPVERVRLYVHPETIGAEVAQRVGSINDSQRDVDNFAEVCARFGLTDYEQEVVVAALEKKATKPGGLPVIGGYAHAVAKAVRAERDDPSPTE